jgi:hypothetical protein
VLICHTRGGSELLKRRYSGYALLTGVLPVAAVAGLLLLSIGVVLSGAATGQQQRALPELRDLYITGWDCLSRDGGSAIAPADRQRNRMKNRPWREPPADAPDWSFSEFIAQSRRFDSVLAAPSRTPARNRRSLTPIQEQRLATIENRVVSVTGWVVIAYGTGAETTNCGSRQNHDWHIEVVPSPRSHPPRAGDATAIIAEVTPRTERVLYRAGVRLQRMAAFIREGAPPNIRAHPAADRPRKVRITGYLLWDDQHNAAETDIGDAVRRGGGTAYHHPWRATAWEIHPILRIELLPDAETAEARGGR